MNKCGWVINGGYCILQQKKDVIEKIKNLIYIVQTNSDKFHLEPYISIDELDEILNIIKEYESNENI